MAEHSLKRLSVERKLDPQRLPDRQIVQTALNLRPVALADADPLRCFLLS